MPYTPLVPDAPALYSTLNDIFEELDDTVVDVLTGVIPVYQLGLAQNSGQAISGGAITITHSWHIIDTQGGAASDDLDTINGNTSANVLFLQCVSGARVITVKNGTGNIHLTGGQDVVLDNQRKVLPLVHDNNGWTELGAGKWTQKLNVGTDTTLTLASDAITITRARHAVDTQGGAASDNLATINGGSEGDVVWLNSVSSARVITIQHGVGNIKTRTGVDAIMDDPNRVYQFIFNGTNWNEITTDGLVAKEPLDTAYSVVRALQLPLNSMRAVSGQANAYEALVLPSPEARSFMRIQASDSTNYFASGEVEWDYNWATISSANGASGKFWQIETSNVTNNTVYVKTYTFALIRRKWNPTFVAKVKFDGATNNRRVWIGLFGADPGDVDTLATHGIGFRYSTNASDTTWKAVCNNGTSQTVVDTGVSVSTTAKATLKFWVDSNNNTVYFSVNNSTPVSISTNLPAENLEMGMIAEISTLNNVVRGLGIGSLYCEYS